MMMTLLMMTQLILLIFMNDADGAVAGSYAIGSDAADSNDW